MDKNSLPEAKWIQVLSVHKQDFSERCICRASKRNLFRRNKTQLGPL